MSARFVRLFIYVLGVLLPGMEAHATHIVGADFTYVQIPGTSRYQIQLKLFQDCLTGDPQAIAQDDPANISVFYGDGTPFGKRKIPAAEQITVPLNFANECINNPPRTCLKRTTFIWEENLPPDTRGYTIAYQRCCRNGSINNIVNPEGVGATYFCTIPPIPRSNNSSAVFKNNPPQIICINNPLVYDNSATDPDGDSLSYEFCEAYQGGGPSEPIPEAQAPPYTIVNYAAGFTPARPFLGNPRIQINPTTGLISGTPTVQGRYVVTVCCNEWRGGVKINTTKREFQFVVTDCSKAVVANIPQYSQEFNTYIVQCKSLTVKFDNQSTGGFQYNWDFGVPNTSTDQSTDFSPTFTYPDTGTYVVTLTVNRGSTCADSISRIVKVYPTFNADYVYAGLPCPNTPIQFTDQSQSRYGPVSSWQWTFGDGQTSTAPNPVVAYPQGGEYSVSLVSGNALGCLDTAIKQLNIERFRPFAGNDTIIVRGESIRFQATGGSIYTWTPATYLNATNIPNPVGYYPVLDSVRYRVDIQSEVGCRGSDDILVWVVNQAALFVPTAFTPNGDGMNDILAPIAIGYRNFNFFRIFNRFGELVYSTEDIGRGWDGTWKGRTADVGVYYWVLSSINRFGQEEMQKGDVTLIR